MSEAKTYTEREVVLRERRAFERGAFEFERGVLGGAFAWEGSAAEAALRFPLPKVTRPRVVADPHGIGKWGVRDGSICYVATCGAWENWSGGMFNVTPARIKAWADLLANPTEEVNE